MSGPVEIQVSEQLKTERNFDNGNQIKDALKNPQLERGLIQGLKKSWKIQAQRAFMILKVVKIYMNVRSEAGSGGAHVIFHKQDDGRFVVGLFSDHDYKAWEKSRNGSFTLLIRDPA